MKKFCTECGKEAEADNQVCIHCGTPFNKEETTETPAPAPAPVKKAPMPKKQKVLLSIIAGVLIIIIGFSMWANNYQSAEAVEKRYKDALEESDASKLKSILVHDDGSKISNEEADAHIKLAKEYSIGGLYDVVESGKFLLLFKAHKVEVIDQYATYDEHIEGLTFTFNEKEFAMEDDGDGYVTYGPFVPGVYTLDVAYENGNSELSVEEELIFDDSYDGDNWIELDLPISEVSIYANNIGRKDLEAYVLMGDEKVAMNEDGDTETFGPILIDGSVEAEVVTVMPWGEVKTDPFPIDERSISVEASFLSKEQFDDIVDMLTLYGEEFTEGLTKGTSKDVSAFTKELKEEMNEAFENDNVFTGKFMNAKIDNTDIELETVEDEMAIKLKTNFFLEGDYHDKNDKPKLEEYKYEWLLTLVYDVDGKAWFIDDMKKPGLWGWTVSDDAMEIKGEEKLYEPGKKKKKDDKKDGKKDDKKDDEKDANEDDKKDDRKDE